MTDDALFAPPHGQWQRLAPGYTTARRLGTALAWTLVFAIPMVLLWIFWTPWPALVVGGIGLVVVIWRVIRVGALCRAYGYAELAEELYLTRGVLFRSLTIVPYGRMQVVEVERGIVDRWFGIASVKLVTASSQTDAHIPGLPPEEAVRLRDRLTELGDARSSGL